MSGLGQLGSFSSAPCFSYYSLGLAWQLSFQQSNKFLNKEESFTRYLLYPLFIGDWLGRDRLGNEFYPSLWVRLNWKVMWGVCRNRYVEHVWSHSITPQPYWTLKQSILTSETIWRLWSRLIDRNSAHVECWVTWLMSWRPFLERSGTGLMGPEKQFLKLWSVCHENLLF